MVRTASCQISLFPDAIWFPQSLTRNQYRGTFSQKHTTGHLDPVKAGLDSCLQIIARTAIP